LATGSAVTRVQELVDPARCRVWDGHNRDYAALSEERCSDLIESMKAQGRQEVPAIVRRVKGDPAHEFEVICGARRHWTVSWLRSHDYPDFRFLIEPRELTDEEAFRIADLENRSRADLTDWERATDYARAVERYYEGSQQRMAERLQVSKSWLSRYLELAKLPEWVVASFGSTSVIGISHAAKLAPLLRAPVSRRAMEEAAEPLAAEQALRGEAGKRLIAPAQVVSRLTERKRSPVKQTRQAVVTDSEQRVVARAERSRVGAITISIPARADVDAEELLAAIGRLLSELR
jgi:ParB family chromosome partitioning protein